MMTSLRMLSCAGPVLAGLATFLLVFNGCDSSSVSGTGQGPGSVTGAVPVTGANPGTGTASAPAPVPSPVPNTDPTTASFQQQVLDLTNQLRAANGVAPLTLNTKLQAAAQAYAQVMAQVNIMNHTGPDGSTPDRRIAAAGYVATTWGENIAEGYATPQDVVAGWTASPGHKANMLNAAYKELGVGYAMGKSAYWVQDFGAQ